MKTRSRLWVIIHHPIQSFLATMAVHLCFWMVVNDFAVRISKNRILSSVFWVVCAWIGIGILKRYYRDRLECYGYDYRGVDHTVKTKPKASVNIGRGYAPRMNSAVNRQSSQAQNNTQKQMDNTYARWEREEAKRRAQEEAQRRAQREAADRAARERWDAIDRQKKAEWDARDAALRGKDKAAWKYKNDADYWRNQSRR